MEEAQLFTFQIADIGIGKGDVDTINCIIRNVSLITGDLVALGHDLEVDDTTTAQVLACARKLGQVAVKLDHGTGILNVNGHLANFHKDGKKNRGDWHLLKTHPNTPQMLELAEKQPRTIGMSVTFRGKPEVKGGKRYARCTELVTVDIVPHPAANPDGLFARGDVDSGGKRMPDPTNPGTAPAAGEGDVLQQILAEVKSISGRLTAVEEFCQDVDGFLSEVDGAPAPGGEGGGGGGGGAPGGGTEMSRRQGGSTNQDPLVEFEARMEQWFAGKMTQLEAEQMQQEMVTSLEALKTKQGQLITQLQASKDENGALHDLVKELRAASPMSPVNGGGVHMFQAQKVDEPGLTQFEREVRKTVTEFQQKSPETDITKIRPQAIKHVINTQPEVYERHRTEGK